MTDIQTRIADAIDDLAADMAAGNTPGVISDIAAEYGLKVDVLAARFERQHGVAHADYRDLLDRRAAEVERGAEITARAEAKRAERDAAETAAIKEWFAANPTAFAGTNIRRRVERADVVTLL